MCKEDCFAYKLNVNKQKYECNALEELYCEKEGKCNFYKSYKKWLEEQEKR